MTKNLQLISQLRKCFGEDSVSLFYHGDFDDYFTEKMITLIGFESKSKIRGNLAFVIAESFQNIVRHKNAFLGIGNENVFGIRGRKSHVHVFSSNLVVAEVKKSLDLELERINNMSKKDLKDAYIQILQEGELSEKGGAGMGLIEMARRSGNKIQYNFESYAKNVFSFDMQVDFNRYIEFAHTPELDIKENSDVTDLILENEVLFIYKGEFSEKVLQPFLPIINKSIKKDDIKLEAILNVAVGLVQNVEHYGKADTNNIKSGLIAITRTQEGYYLCSGNYTSENTSRLRELVDSMNTASKSDLTDIYSKALKEKQLDITNVERVGLLNIRRTSSHPIELKIIEDEYGSYAMLGVNITKDSTLVE